MELSCFHAVCLRRSNIIANLAFYPRMKSRATNQRAMPFVLVGQIVSSFCQQDKGERFGTRFCVRSGTDDSNAHRFSQTILASFEDYQLYKAFRRWQSRNKQ